MKSLVGKHRFGKLSTFVNYKILEPNIRYIA